MKDKILTARGRIEGERKLVTVLFADVANYTSMAERLDPEDVHRIMDGCFRILVNEIYRHEGTIDQFTGDGVMALFGVPLAHEDHAQRAGYAALSIQEAVGDYGERVRQDWGVDFKVRIGLNSGLVVVDTIGDDLRMEYTAIGDTANLASRMENMANPGSILVSGNTYKLVKDYFHFEPLGKIRVKGKEAPQEAFELLGPAEVETRIEAAEAKGLTRFVGRRKQVTVLREAFEKARGGSGQAIGIKGDAGVGKSRLLREFLNTLPGKEHVLLEGRCLHHGASVVYLPILGVLRSFFDIQEGDTEREIQQKVRHGLDRFDVERLRTLPALQDVLSLEIGDSTYMQIDPQQRRRKIFEAVRDLLIRASLEKPYVIAMEDLHWIDRPSRDFIDFFMEALPDAPVLLVLVYRPEFTCPWGDKSCFTQMELDELSHRSRNDLVEAILEEGEVTTELRDLILDRAGGNPLFMEELTCSLVENGSIRREGNRCVLTRRPSEIQVPDTVQGIIAARMDRLQEGLKRILQAASVIGREFSCRILRTVTGMGKDLEASLLDLQGSELIYEQQRVPEKAYIFKHALTQEVVYNGLLLKKRRALHAKIGDTIERIHAGRLEQHYELLAHHYVRSDDKQKAIEYLDLASRKAAHANAPEEAKAYFDRAMELLDTLPDTEENRVRRISLLPAQSNVFWKLLKGPQYLELLKRHEPTAAGLRNAGLRGAFYARLGLNESMLGQLERGIETQQKALEVLDSAEDKEETAIAYYCLAMCYFLKSDYDQGFRFNEEYLRTMAGSFHLGSYVRLTSMVSQAYAQLGRWEEAVEYANKALHLAEHYSDDSSIAQAEMLFGAIYTYKGDLEQAIEYAERAVCRASTPADKATAQMFLAWPLCHAGEPGRGIEMLNSIVPLFKAVRLKWWELWGTFFLADGYWLAGENEKGKEAAAELLAVADSCGARYFTGYGCFLLGELSGDNDPDQAAAHFEKSITVFQEITAENALAMAYAGRGRLHGQQGNKVQARTYLTKALEIFERLGTPVEPDRTREALAELER